MSTRIVGEADAAGGMDVATSSQGVLCSFERALVGETTRAAEFFHRITGSGLRKTSPLATKCRWC